MARRLDEDLVILDVPSGRYFELNDVGAVVWEHLDGVRSVDDIVDRVVEEYDVDRATASADVQDLLGQLIRAGLVVNEP